MLGNVGLPYRSCGVHWAVWRLLRAACQVASAQPQAMAKHWLRHSRAAQGAGTLVPVGAGEVPAVLG